MSTVAKAPRTRPSRAPRTSRPAAAPRKASATRKSAPVAKAKPAERKPRFRGGPRQRLVAILPLLEKQFGAIQPPETTSVLEKAVYLVLREGAGEPAGGRALASLREGFIDWNEVRASRPVELAVMMSPGARGAAQRRLLDTARRVKDLIDQVYGDRNDTSLEFLLEQKTKERLEYLEDLEDLGLHNAYALAQWLSAEDKLVAVSPGMAKAAHRLGLSDSAAVAKVRTSLSSLQKEPAGLVALQAHLTQLGELEESRWPPSLQEFVD
jgi:hypothetical protein